MTAPVLCRAVACLAAAMLVACSSPDQTPTSIRSRSAALSLKTPTTHSAAIRQRVADRRRQGLSAGDKARIVALSGKWSWAANLHHQAMQEAIHDPRLGGLREQHSVAERCAAAIDYFRKYQATAARHAEQSLLTADVQEASLRTGLAQEGLCDPAPAQASLFAAPRTPLFHRARSAALTPLAAANRAKAQQLADNYHDYLNALLADIQGAKDLADFNDIMDHYVAAAATDADLGPSGAALVAGTIDLARSSAQEWDAFARPREGSMFMWGWLSSVGNWIIDVVSSDVYGCGYGAALEFEMAEDLGFLMSADDLAGDTEGYCGSFSLASSVGAAI